MAIKITSYDNYLSQIGALVGVPSTRISTEMAGSLNAAFNSAFSRAFFYYDWQEVSPYGEARFVGNKFGYANDLSQTSEWTAGAMTVTGGALANPLDGRLTASKLLETSATAAHKVTHSNVGMNVSTTYVYSVYAAPINDSWVYLNLNDGDKAHTCFFNIVTGALGAASNCTGQIQSVGSGFYLCSIQFTTSTSATANTSSITIQASTDGSTLSYAGNTANGLYLWGALLQQTTNTGINDSLVAYDQTGETRIDTVFAVWKDSPFNSTLPRKVGYTLTASGIQILSGAVVSYAIVNSAGVTITTQQSNPVYLYYKQDIPNFSGSTYSATATYAVNNQIYYTATDGTSDFWKAIAATTAGQSPDTTPTSWQKQQIPLSFFYAVLWQAFGDFLASDGQSDKSTWAYQVAQARLEDSIETQSRQQQRDFPITVSTHLTSRSGAYW